jgi:hypothetical protein
MTKLGLLLCEWAHEYCLVFLLALRSRFDTRSIFRFCIFLAKLFTDVTYVIVHKSFNFFKVTICLS